MDLNRLVIFAKIAENQSFTKAAHALNMNKSTVSNKLSQLEAHLGVRLLNRSTRSVTLTEAGAGYYRYCQHIIETAQEAEHFTTTLGSEAVGLLRVAAPHEFGDYLIRKLIQPFMRANPKIEIEFVLGYRNVDLIKEQFDVALRVSKDSLIDSNLVARNIVSSEICLVCSPAFIKDHGKPDTVEQIKDYDFIEFTSAIPNALPITQSNTPHQIAPRGRFKVNDILSTKEAALSGIGIAILPKFVVADEIKTDDLIAVLTDCIFPTFNIYAVYPSRQWMPAKLTQFLDYLKHLEGDL